MDKTPLDRLPFDVPDGIRPYVAGADIYDSSCSPEARVLFIDKGNGCYLKRSEKGALEKEAAMAAKEKIKREKDVFEDEIEDYFDDADENPGFRTAKADDAVNDGVQSVSAEYQY